MPASYLLDNADARTATRFRCLSKMYDPVSVRAFDAIGVGGGWRCLDVGAGGGSIARYLAARTGHVVATDVDTRWLDVGPTPLGMTVQRHDITADPIAPAEYDLIHARLVLMHLPKRAAALASLVAALRPGGWLVVGELDPVTPYVPDPHNATDRLINTVGDAFTAALAGRGADNTTGQRLHRTLAAAGLIDVDNRGDVVVGVAGSPAAHLMAANVEQVFGGPRRTGRTVSHDMVEQYLRALDDPAVTFLMPTYFCAIGRRPA